MRWEGDDEEACVDDALGDELGLGPDDLARWFGTGWRVAPLTTLQPVELERRFTPWCVSGDPVQLMLRAERGTAELAVPVGVWEHGTHGLAWRPHDVAVVDVRRDDEEDALATVTRLLRRRRAGFRYCRYCRAATAPEQRVQADVCMACATRWLGVVY